MSWFGAIKKPFKSDSREEKRQRLEEERLQRNRARALRQQQLHEAQKAQQKADKTC